MGRLRTVLAISLVLFAVTLESSASAQEEAQPPRVLGVLISDGVPVADATIRVTEVDGDFMASTTSGADGSWEVELPARRGTYDIELDLTTLGSDVSLSDDGAAVLRSSITRAGQSRAITFRLGESLIVGKSTGEQLAQSALNGVKFGLIIAMAAVGLSLVFATTRLINFAAGELVAFGAALAWWLNTQTLEAHLILAGVIAVIGGSLLGAGMEKGIMRPLRRRKLGPFQFVVVTIGLSLIGRQLIQMWIGEGNQTYRQYQIQTPWEFGPFELTPRDLTIIAGSALTLVLVAAVLQLTRTGKAMRAVSDNPDLAASTGIAVNRVILTVWMAGGGLAALGGVFFGLSEIVKFDMGFRLLLLMFAAVILGGLGTAYGAMVGGLLIGLVTEISTVWIQPELKFVWALLALVFVLLLRPQGILGARERVG